MTKTCTRCSTERNIKEFDKHKYGRRNTCKYCRQAVNRAAYQTKKNSPELKASNHARQIKVQYGISIEQYNEMLKRQNGVCKICKSENNRRLCVDHCHKTGRIRGLLCDNCNKAMGILGDDPVRLRLCAKYLEESC